MRVDRGGGVVEVQMGRAPQTTTFPELDFLHFPSLAVAPYRVLLFSDRFWHLNLYLYLSIPQPLPLHDPAREARREKIGFWVPAKTKSLRENDPAREARREKIGFWVPAKAKSLKEK